MSVVLRLPHGEILLYVKGADSSILPHVVELGASEAAKTEPQITPVWELPSHIWSTGGKRPKTNARVICQHLLVKARASGNFMCFSFFYLFICLWDLIRQGFRQNLHVQAFAPCAWPNGSSPTRSLRTTVTNPGNSCFFVFIVRNYFRIFRMMIWINWYEL